MESILKQLKSTLKRRLRTLRKSLKSQEEHLKACQNWQALQHEAELIQAHFYLIKKGDEKILVSDWAQEGKELLIALDKSKKPAEDVAKRFKRATKLKKGLPFAEKEVARLQEAIRSCLEMEEALQQVNSEEELASLKEKYPFPTPQEKKKPEEKALVKPYREFKSASGIPIWVGKNGAMNDQLTFRYANGNDLWLHVADHAGSHVVIHSAEFDEETLKQAQALALYYSKARRFKEGEVVMTEVKHVRKAGKESGKVQIAKEKRAFIRLP